MTNKKMEQIKNDLNCALDDLNRAQAALSRYYEDEPEHELYEEAYQIFYRLETYIFDNDLSGV